MKIGDKDNLYHNANQRLKIVAENQGLTFTKLLKFSKRDV